MLSWKELVKRLNQLNETKSNKQKEYDKLADKVMKDTRHITSAVKVRNLKKS